MKVFVYNFYHNITSLKVVLCPTTQSEITILFFAKRIWMKFVTKLIHLQMLPLGGHNITTRFNSASYFFMYTMT